MDPGSDTADDASTRATAQNLRLTENRAIAQNLNLIETGATAQNSNDQANSSGSAVSLNDDSSVLRSTSPNDGMAFSPAPTASPVPTENESELLYNMETDSNHGGNVTPKESEQTSSIEVPADLAKFQREWSTFAKKKRKDELKAAQVAAIRGTPQKPTSSSNSSNQSNSDDALRKGHFAIAGDAGHLYERQKNIGESRKNKSPPPSSSDAKQPKRKDQRNKKPAPEWIARVPKVQEPTGTTTDLPFPHHPQASLVNTLLRNRVPLEQLTAEQIELTQDVTLYRHIPSTGYQNKRFVTSLFPQFLDQQLRLREQNSIPVIELQSLEAACFIRDETAVIIATFESTGVLPPLPHVPNPPADQAFLDTTPLPPVIPGRRWVLYQVIATGRGQGAILEAKDFLLPSTDRKDLHIVAIDQHSVNVVSGKRGFAKKLLSVKDLIAVYELEPTASAIRNPHAALAGSRFTRANTFDNRSQFFWKAKTFCIIRPALFVEPKIGTVLKKLGTKDATNNLRAAFESVPCAVTLSPSMCDFKFADTAEGSMILAHMRQNTSTAMRFSEPPASLEDRPAKVQDCTTTGEFVIATAMTNMAVTQFTRTLLELDDFQHITSLRFLADGAINDESLTTPVDLAKLLMEAPRNLRDVLQPPEATLLRNFAAARERCDLYKTEEHRELDLTDEERLHVSLAEETVSEFVSAAVNTFTDYVKPNVVCMTTSSLLNTSAPTGILRKALTEQPFTTIIFEEASQVNDPAFITISNRFPNCRIVVIGDRKQLAPHNRLPPDWWCSRVAAHGVMDTLNEAGAVPTIQIAATYRCHPDIVELANAVAYDHILTTPVTAADRTRFTSVFEVDSPVLLVDCTTAQGKNASTKSLFNDGERALAKKFLEAMSSSFAVNETAAICFYSAQRSKMLEECDGRFEACTVDTVQGREVELSAILTSRQEVAAKTDFFDDLRRVNVALTRARQGLVIFGNVAVLRQYPGWSKVVAFVESRKSIWSADDFERKLAEVTCPSTHTPHGAT